MKYYAIASIKKQNFLAEQRIFPAYTRSQVAYYRPAARFYDALDRYEIKYNIIGRKPW